MGLEISYWPQQLNFAVWCSTTGRGISCEVLNKVPEQIKSFLMFHMYFTVRRILFEMVELKVKRLLQETQRSVR